MLSFFSPMHQVAVLVERRMAPLLKDIPGTILPSETLAVIWMRQIKPLMLILKSEIWKPLTKSQLKLGQSQSLLIAQSLHLTNLPLKKGTMKLYVTSLKIGKHNMSASRNTCFKLSSSQIPFAAKHGQQTIQCFSHGDFYQLLCQSQHQIKV